MDARLQRMSRNATKLDRLRVREAMKEDRERQLVNVKVNALPFIRPSMKRDKDSKCERCDVDKETFTRHDDWYLEPIDALQMQMPTETRAWINLPNITELMNRKSLSRQMDSLVIHPAHIVMMANMMKKSPNVPLVFVLKTENAEIDIAMLNFILHANRVKRPLFIVDDKLEQTFNEARLASHLQAHGDVLVMLDGDDDENLEKVLNACGFGLAVKVFLLPVTINYEKIPLYSPSKFFGDKGFGIVKVNFHEAHTVADFIDADKFSEEMDEQQQFEGVTKISKHLSYDMVMKRPIMSTNVVAFLLLTAYRDGASVDDLAIKLDEMRNGKFSLDYAFEGEPEDIVERAIKMLGDLVVVEANHFKPSQVVSKVVQLAKYAAPLVPHYAMESVLVISAQTIKSTEKYLDFHELIAKATELCELLQGEFQLFKPCQNLEIELQSKFDALSMEDIMSKPKNDPMTGNEQRARRMARQYESDEGSDDDGGYQKRNINNEVKINLNMEKELKALENVIKPYIETFLTTICILKDLRKAKRLSEDELLKLSMKAMREECEDGNCLYWESCCEDWMRSSFKCLELLKIIQIDRYDDKSMVNIHPDYDSSAAIELLINRIGLFLA